jgi:hypothetical protein
LIRPARMLRGTQVVVRRRRGRVAELIPIILASTRPVVNVTAV